MPSELQERISQLTNPQLLEQYFNHPGEFAEEALAAMKTEIETRKISQEEIAPYLQQAQAQTAEQTPREFVSLPDVFSQTDILLVHTILRDAEVPFYVDRPTMDSVLPLIGQADIKYTIHVLSTESGRATELIHEHFHPQDGEYRLKHTGLKDRLRSFGFTEVRLSESDLEEEIDVVLTAQERSTVTAYAKRVLAEIDALEGQGRVVFNYDNIDEMLGRLGKGEKAKLRAMDLLTVLEVLQVYCDEPEFTDAMVQSAGALLDIFEKN